MIQAQEHVEIWMDSKERSVTTWKRGYKPEVAFIPFVYRHNSTRFVKIWSEVLSEVRGSH